MVSNEGVVSGAELEQLMDRLEADYEEIGCEVEIGLLERLRVRPLHADSMDSVDRLHTLWMIAGDPKAARAVVNDDGAMLLQAAQPDKQADIRMLLTLQRLHIAEYLEEDATVLDELIQMRTIVTENPGIDVSTYILLPILDRLEEEGSPDIVQETAALRDAFELAMDGYV